jgi:signal transduction histidine kinase
MLLRSIEFSNDKVINSDDLVKIGKLEKGIEIINDRSKGITGFIEKYRQLTKLPKPVCQQVSVKKLIEETVLMHEELLTRNKIKCITEVYPSDLNIIVDEQLIMQVLINLFKNSVEALEEVERPQINLSAKLNNENKVIVTICDNGCGIENDDLNDIFIPFFTTKKLGSGIGLSLSKQIMNLHKGELNVKQNESKTEFIVIF